MEITKILYTCCKIKSCTEIAVYEFNDVKDTIPEGSLESGEQKETITLGYSCDEHVEEVNKMLKEIHNGN
tara:strand:- start:218 stop:427 length:210 start_codon:yes stop_codon:yes gene_type:complete